MSNRRNKRATSLYELPTLPFLSIMLGLMSVMVLTILGISVERRDQLQKNALVELVGMPARFIPFHMRCRPASVDWLDDDNQWHTVPLSGIVALADVEYSRGLALSVDGRRMMSHIFNKISENQSLSYSRRQNTLILWVEPDGIDASAIVQLIIARQNLPLRVGSLPIRQGEKIRHVPTGS